MTPEKLALVKADALVQAKQHLRSAFEEIVKPVQEQFEQLIAVQQELIAGFERLRQETVDKWERTIEDALEVAIEMAEFEEQADGSVKVRIPAITETFL